MADHPIDKITKADMESIFEKMGEICAREDITLEIAVYGGSALMLEFDYRQATFDIDYVPVIGASDKVKEVAERAAVELGLHEGILRDDVMIFVSDSASYQSFGEFPKSAGNFRVFTATPEYIFAMKMLAMRSSMETQDLRDIWEISSACGIKNIDAAVDILAQYYPTQKLPVRNRVVNVDA